MEVLGVFAIVFVFAFLTETLTEFVFGDLFDRVPKLTPHKWALKYIAIAVGIGGAILYRFDVIHLSSVMIFDLMGKVEGAIVPPILEITVPGMIMTGVGVGKGSNYLHQFVSQFFPAKVK